MQNTKCILNYANQMTMQDMKTKWPANRITNKKL